MSFEEGLVIAVCRLLEMVKPDPQKPRSFESKCSSSFLRGTLPADGRHGVAVDLVQNHVVHLKYE